MIIIKLGHHRMKVMFDRTFINILTLFTTLNVAYIGKNMMNHLIISSIVLS